MPILDQFGRMMEATPARELLERQATASVGSVRQIQTGHPADGLEPMRLAGILREAETGDMTRYLELAEQMEEKDLHYAAVLGVRKRAIRALELHVDPADDSPAAQDAAEMVRGVLGSAAIKEDLIDMLDAVGKGFSVTEIIWGRDGNRLKVDGLEWVDPRWFEFDKTNGRHLYLRDNAGPQQLRADCYIIHTARAKSGLPIRGGLARLAAWAYMFKNFAIKDWAIFCEAYGHPLRLGKYDTASSQQDRQALLRAVRQIGVDMAAIIPKSMEIEIVAAAKTGADKLYEGKARYWDEQLSKGVLGQVATTDAIAGGHAVGKIHEEVRSDIRDADAEQLASTLQRDLAGALVRVNLGAQYLHVVPKLRFAQPERLPPEIMLKLLEAGPKAGLRIATSDVRKTFNLRKPDDDEEVLTGAAVSAPPPVAVPPPVPTARQLASVVQPAVDSIDALVDELIAGGDMQAAMEGEIGALLEALEAAADMDDVRDILAAFQGGGASGPVQDLLSGATFAARLAGETGAEVRD